MKLCFKSQGNVILKRENTSGKIISQKLVIARKKTGRHSLLLCEKTRRYLEMCEYLDMCEWM